MRFTRFSSDGDSVVQERIWMRMQTEELHKPPAKEEVIETHSFENNAEDNACSAARRQVIAGIEDLLRSTAAAA